MAFLSLRAIASISSTRLRQVELAKPTLAEQRRLLLEPETKIALIQ